MKNLDLAFKLNESEKDLSEMSAEVHELPPEKSKYPRGPGANNKTEPTHLEHFIQSESKQSPQNSTNRNENVG